MDLCTNWCVIIKNIVMGVLDKIKNTKQKKQQEQQLKQYIELSSDELKYLITLISKTEFIGKDIQIIYSIVAKLQNQLNK